MMQPTIHPRLNHPRPTTRYGLTVGSFFVACVFGLQLAATGEEPTVGNQRFRTSVLPIVKARCIGCHGPDQQNADVRLDLLSSDLVRDRAGSDTWHDALNAIHRGEMPPEDATPLTRAERTTLTQWITDELKRAEHARISTGGQVAMRRLSRVEYQNTMRDLLGIDLDYAKDLPPDPVSRDGFTNNGASSSMSAMQLEQYLRAARLAVQRAIVEGPQPPVFQTHCDETIADKGKGNWTNRLGRSGQFVARIAEFPNHGEFVIRVRAHAEFPPAELPPGETVPEKPNQTDESPYGIMQVSLGYRADVSAPSAVVGSVDVSSEQTVEFEFRGRMEEFPIQTRTQSKYPGMLIWVRNVYTDGGQPPEPAKVVELLGSAKKGAAIEPAKQPKRLGASQQPELLGSANKSAKKDAKAGDSNALGAQQGAKKKDKKKRRKKDKKKDVYVEDPTFPKIVIDSVEFKSPEFARWPPPHHVGLIVRQPRGSDDERTVAKESLDGLIARAFRRPATDADVDRFLKFYDTVRPSAPSFEAAMREVIVMVLVSPEFLFLTEPQADRQPLSSSEVAARLSYFLWSSMPDDRLSRLAAESRLLESSVLLGEVDRMLKDPRSNTFSEQFTDQWLDLAGVQRIAVNPEFYPGFDNALKEDMRLEPQRFFAEVLRSDLSALTLLDSNFIVVNQQLAKHYGIRGPRGSRFERVELPEKSIRGGLLAQAAILLANSTGEDSHPIKRAVWLRKRLLDDPPAPPPPDVPDLNQDLPDLAALPLKAQLEQHRENESCAACHRDLDPWGIALEQFDAVGLQRTVIRRPHPKGRGRHLEYPVDAVGNLPDGSRVDGATELKSYLLREKSDAFARTLVTKMLAYATGRSLEIGDEVVVEDLTRRFIDSGYKLNSLIRMIVASESFRQG